MNMKMSRRTALVNISTAIGIVCATAINAPAQTSPASIVAGRLIAQGTITKIDHKQRTMLLKLPGGDQLTLTVSPKAKGFDQLQPGDPVAVDYLEAISVALQAASAQVPTASAQTYRLEVPGNPAGALVSTLQITATVEAIDQKSRIVTLRGPDGDTIKVHVVPEAGSLDQIKPSDLVIARYTQALAIDIRKASLS